MAQTEMPECTGSVHIWRLKGATTASDGYECLTCGARVEVWPDHYPEDGSPMLLVRYNSEKPIP